MHVMKRIESSISYAKKKTSTWAVTTWYSNSWITCYDTSQNFCHGIIFKCTKKELWIHEQVFFPSVSRWRRDSEYHSITLRYYKNTLTNFIDIILKTFFSLNFKISLINTLKGKDTKGLDSYFRNWSHKMLNKHAETLSSLDVKLLFLFVGICAIYEQLI